MSVEITYSKEKKKGDLTIRRYSYPNLAKNYATIKSTFRFIFMLNGDFVS